MQPKINGTTLRYAFEDRCLFDGPQSEELNELKESIETADQNRPPLKVINGYAILDHLGSGAFGSVFKVLAIILSFDMIIFFHSFIKSVEEIWFSRCSLICWAC